jgi:hypothetical protein
MTMRFKMATRYEIWKHAVEQLGLAIAALDQAHASMRDVGLDDVPSDPNRNSLLILDLVQHAERILEGIKTAECEECFHAIAKHGDRYGCEYERGDGSVSCRDGETIEAALGPCCCGWGLQRAAAPRRAEGETIA